MGGRASRVELDARTSDAELVLGDFPLHQPQSLARTCLRHSGKRGRERRAGGSWPGSSTSCSAPKKLNELSASSLIGARRRWNAVLDAARDTIAFCPPATFPVSTISSVTLTTNAPLCPRHSSLSSPLTPLSSTPAPMASSVETAVSTSTDIPITRPDKQYVAAAAPQRDSNGAPASNGQPRSAAASAAASAKNVGKYRHVVAVHHQARPSCLSQDAEKPPSFVGFRNLMFLVLSTLHPQGLHWLMAN